MVSFRGTVLSFLSLMSMASGKPLDSRGYSPAPSGGGFAHATGRTFSEGYLAGTNAYWLSTMTDDATVDQTMSQIAAAKLDILRVWGFADVNSTPSPGTVYFQVLSSSGGTINTGADGLQRLDVVVQAAEKYGVKLVIPFVNNWDAYGGIPAYVQAFGCSATSWYTDSKSQEVYKAYVKAVIGRYKTSTAIFAWELANEPRCVGCPTSVITEWATGISQYIKTLDSNHMVALGDEGFFDNGSGNWLYNGAEGLDFKKNLAIESIDYGTVHLYPESWSQTGDWGNTWITEHDQAGQAAGKPVVIEEYGALTNQLATMTSWQKTLLNSGIALDQFWQYSNPNSPGAMDGYAVAACPGLLQACQQHAAAIEGKSGGSSPPASPSSPASSSSAKGSASPTKSNTAETPSSYNTKPVTAASPTSSAAKPGSTSSSSKPHTGTSVPGTHTSYGAPQHSSTTHTAAAAATTAAAIISSSYGALPHHSTSSSSSHHSASSDTSKAAAATATTTAKATPTQAPDESGYDDEGDDGDYEDDGECEL